MRISRRLTGVRFLTLLAALAAGAIAVSLSFGSSHREAPGTMLDPSADDTDVYAFVANDAKGPERIATIAKSDAIELVEVAIARDLSAEKKRVDMKLPADVQLP